MGTPDYCCDLCGEPGDHEPCGRCGLHVCEACELDGPHEEHHIEMQAERADPHADESFDRWWAERR